MNEEAERRRQKEGSGVRSHRVTESGVRSQESGVRSQESGVRMKKEEGRRKKEERRIFSITNDQ